jgi:hypothetical protein
VTLKALDALMAQHGRVFLIRAGCSKCAGLPLWNHLLRRLAPDDLVAAWIPGVSNQKDLLHEGKPTRRARVLYVCRELNNDRLTDE